MDSLIRSRAALALAALVFAAALGYLIVRAAQGLDRAVELLRSPSDELLLLGDFSLWPPIVALGVAGLAAFAGWWLSGRRAGDLESERSARERAEAELEGARAELVELEDEARAQRRRAELEREGHVRQREVARELREQVHELHAEQGGLGDHADVRVLVLRVAMRLLDAEKGLLLSRVDADADG